MWTRGLESITQGLQGPSGAVLERVETATLFHISGIYGGFIEFDIRLFQGLGWPG